MCGFVGFYQTTKLLDCSYPVKYQFTKIDNGSSAHRGTDLNFMRARDPVGVASGLIFIVGIFPLDPVWVEYKLTHMKRFVAINQSGFEI